MTEPKREWEWCFECDNLMMSKRKDGSIFKYCLYYKKPVSKKVIKQCIIDTGEYEYCPKCEGIFPAEWDLDGICPECGEETTTMKADEVIKMLFGEENREVDTK